MTTTPHFTFRITRVRLMLIGMTALFAGLALYRLAFGLGASTHLSDRWPWGLWIGFDLSAVALAGAGFSTCLLAHVLHIEDFHSVGRRAMLLSLLGYLFLLLTLVLEVGRWDNVYRPLISWGHASPLFEVFVAITVYMVIQFIEFSDVATEKVFKPARPWIRAALPAAYVLGAIIPFGHQASLGAIYLLMKGKLHGLWWSEMIPWFFLLSSFYAGQAVVVLESLWASKAFDRSVDLRIMHRLMRICAVLMAIQVLWKILDLWRLGALRLAFAGTYESWFLALEIIALTALPAILVFTPWGKTRAGLLCTSILSAAGVVLSRLNVVFTGMHRALGSGYTPSWMEWGITLGLGASMVLIYLFVVENFDIFGEHRERAVHVEPSRHAAPKGLATGT